MYAKVFAQIFDGSLCTHGPWEALVTFQQLLVLADQEGNVDMTAEAISRRTTIPLGIIQVGIAALLRPDPQSRTPTESGRRIIPLSEGRDWGWLVVNYKHYRQLKREEDRREYHREYWHTRKTKSAATQQTQQTQPNQPIAEAKAEKDLSQPSVAHPPARAGGKKAPAIACPYDAIISRYSTALPSLPGVLMRDGPTWTKRQKAMRDFWSWLLASKRPDGSRRAEGAEEALVWIETYFARASDNDFVMGRTQPGRGHEGWRADLDYLLSAKGMKQVLERTQEAS